jgi:thiamine-phosphate pyrophosphorylase
VSGGPLQRGPRGLQGPGGTVPSLYAIADAGALGPGRVPEAVAAMAGAGIGWIQLRAKYFPGDELYRLAAACCRAVEGSAARLWIDDRADLAALLPFAGLHLGQTDLPPGAARRVFSGSTGSPGRVVSGGGGERIWIGLSTHDEGQLAAAAADPEVDVVAVGPVYPTAGKDRPDPPVGLDFVRRARAATDKPLVAIGGIDAHNLAEVLAAGADAVAVLGAVCRGDVAANCRRLLASAGCASS